MHWSHITPRKIPTTHFCQRLSGPQGPSGLKGLGQLKNPMISEIEPATFRLVARCVNQLCYRVLFPGWIINIQHALVLSMDLRDPEHFHAPNLYESRCPITIFFSGTDAFIRFIIKYIYSLILL
jgi:hypothetical protein